MALDKVLKIYDENGNPVDYDILASDVKFLPDGKDLPTKLAEMEDEIGEGGYTPPEGGIPATDLAQAVQTILNDVANKVDKESGKSLMTDAERTKLQNLPTADQLTQQLDQKANDNAVVKSISVNGTAQTKDSNGNVNIEVQGGGLSKEDISVETQGDGTVDINVKDDKYTINLNHTHEGMAKLVVCEESDLPSTLDEDTIYGVEDSGEISMLYIGGVPFYGGGGSTEPRLRKPADGSTIDLGDTSSGSLSETVNVKGRNLTEALTIELAGTGYTFGNTQPSGVTRDSSTQLTVTAAAANALAGVNIVVEYSGSDNDWNAEGTLSITSGSPDNISVEATLVVNQTVLPSGYTSLEKISEITDFITTNINAQGTTWELDLSAGSQTTQTEVAIIYGMGSSLPPGKFVVGAISGLWSLAGGIQTTAPKDQRTTLIVSFSASQASLTIGNETVTRATANTDNGAVMLFGATPPNEQTNYKIRGDIYSVKCTAGGSFYGLPAKRTSDDKEGIYDFANDTFYPLK